jgi:putative hydrolase of the HAD superfamily
LSGGGGAGDAQDVERVVFDFDGTLAHRRPWSQAVLEVLDAHLPDHGATVESIRPLLRNGFPWHQPHVAHPQLCEPSVWWEHVGALLGSAMAACGVHPDDVPALVLAVREHYCDPARFVLYDDTRPTLQRLRDLGVEVAILSNHVPELVDIVEGLGLGPMVGRVVSSGVIGYEKPNPEAYRHVLDGVDPSACAMVGDNPVADVEGATAAGMQAVLVRHLDSDGRTVAEAVDFLLGTDRPET